MLAGADVYTETAARIIAEFKPAYFFVKGQPVGLQDIRANDRRWQQQRMVDNWAAKQREIARELSR